MNLTLKSFQVRNHRTHFRRPECVHEPVMMLLDVTDRGYVDHLEKVVGRSKLLAFVCEEWDDCQTLMQARTRERFQQVNVVLQKPDLNTNGRQVAFFSVK